MQKSSLRRAFFCVESQYLGAAIGAASPSDVIPGLCRDLALFPGVTFMKNHGMQNDRIPAQYRDERCALACGKLFGFCLAGDDAVPAEPIIFLIANRPRERDEGAVGFDIRTFGFAVGIERKPFQ